MSTDAESAPSSGHAALDKASAAIERLRTVDPGDVQKVAASQIELLQSFYELVVAQARRSFFWALVASGVGLLFFLAAISFFLAANRDVAVVSVISGAVIEVIAGLNFVLYGRTTAQLSVFHSRLELTQRFLLANSLCEGLEGDLRGQTRATLINKLASIALAQITSQPPQKIGGDT